jgi:O-antigen/teichoic acid export membrane protein
MLVATFVSAGGAFLYLLIVGRALGPTAFAPITVLWTVQYLVATVVYLPIEQLTVRRLSRKAREATPWALYLWVTLACTLAVVVFGTFTLDRFFAGQVAYLPIIGLLTVGYAGFAIGRGYLAGRRRFREFAYAISTESLLRLLLAVILLAAGVRALGLAALMAAAPFAVWLWRPLRGRRSFEAAAGPEQGATAALGAFVSATAASQTLLAAGPLAVGALGGSAAEVSVLGQTFLLLRAPLAVTFNLVSRVMPPLTRFVDTAQFSRIRRLGVGLGTAGLTASAAGFGIGYAAGPPLVAWLMGPEYRPAALLAALAAAGTALATVAAFAQQVLVAMGSSGRLAAGWLSGLAAAVAVVLATIGRDATLRVGWAFLTGELVAFALIIGVITSTAPGRDRPRPEPIPEPPAQL